MDTLEALTARVLDQVTGRDGAETDYVLSEPLTCPRCAGEVTEAPHPFAGGIKARGSAYSNGSGKNSVLVLEPEKGARQGEQEPDHRKVKHSTGRHFQAEDHSPDGAIVGRYEDSSGTVHGFLSLPAEIPDKRTNRDLEDVRASILDTVWKAPG